MTTPSESKRYYEEINLFRGFAIFSIVFGHLLVMTPDATGIKWTTAWTNVHPVLTMAYAPGGSWYFVFISGFLFYPVFFSRGYDYKKFIYDKLKKVFLPCVILATIFILSFWGTSVTKPIHIWNLLARTSFWYFPFIMCMFLISPLFITLINIKFKYQIGILIFSSCISVVIRRVPDNPPYAASISFLLIFWV